MVIVKVRFQILLSILICGFGLVILANGCDNQLLAFAGLLLQCGALVGIVRARQGDYLNLSMLFVLFYMIYCLSGPWQVIVGQRLTETYGSFFPLPAIALLQACAGLGLGLGLFAPRLAISNGEPRRVPSSRVFSIVSNPSSMRGLGVVTAGLGSAMELVNFVRVGGIPAFALGKAYYQSQVSDLTLTLPGFNLVLVGAVLFGLGTRSRGNSDGNGWSILRRTMPFFLAAGFAFFIALGIGRRGVILAILMVMFLGLYFGRPIRKVKFSLVVTVLVAYMLMGMLYANRSILAYTLVTGDTQYLEKNLSDWNRTLKSMNPALVEFGAPFGNLAVYLDRGPGDSRWGATYLKGALVPVPALLYPGSKPRQITYEFRDDYFPDQARRGGIASTGFSAILEAHINFGILGIVGVYAVCGFVLSLVDRRRVEFGVLGAIVYCLSAPLTQIWHRSAFGDVFANFIVNSVMALFFLVIAELIVRVLRVVARASRVGAA